MVYYVLEFQTNDGTGAVIPYAFNNIDDAEEKYHQILMYAAKSSIKKHGAMLCDDDMSRIKSEMYYHGVEDKLVEENVENVEI